MKSYYNINYCVLIFKLCSYKSHYSIVSFCPSILSLSLSLSISILYNSYIIPPDNSLALHKTALPTVRKKFRICPRCCETVEIQYDLSQ